LGEGKTFGLGCGDDLGRLRIEEAGEDEATAGADEVRQTLLYKFQDDRREDIYDYKIGLIK